jgi:hypothetical protein
VGVNDGEGIGVDVVGVTVTEAEVETAMTVDAVVVGRAGWDGTSHAVNELRNKSSNKYFLDTAHLITAQRTNAIVR